MTKISIVGATTWGTTLAIVNAIGNQENEIMEGEIINKEDKKKNDL